MDAAHALLSARLLELLSALERAPLVDAMECSVAVLMKLHDEFAGEEALMERHRYPDLLMHRASHALLEGEFSGLAREIRDAGREPLSGTRVHLLEKLFVASQKLAAHAQQADIPLARFMRAAPVTRRVADPPCT